MASKEMMSGLYFASIESSLDQELSVVRCQFWVERWRAAELCLTHGEFIDIGFFGHSVFCLLNPVFFQLSFFAQLGLHSFLPIRQNCLKFLL